MAGTGRNSKKLAMLCNIFKEIKRGWVKPLRKGGGGVVGKGGGGWDWK